MKQKKMDWLEYFDSAITVCDRAGTIIYMNEKAFETFAAGGGDRLLGQNLEACHKPESWALISRMLAEGRSNTYTIEKKGKKKLIHQAPWRTAADGPCAGLVEIAVEMPADMPHHRRD